MKIFGWFRRNKKNSKHEKNFKEERKETIEDIQLGVVEIEQVDETETSVINALKEKYISIDFETTGLDPYADRIIEIGAVVYEKGEKTRSFNTLVNSFVDIPENITSINHITNEMIWGAPTENITFLEFVEFLGEAMEGKIILCAHNAKFDLGFLKSTLCRLGYDATLRYVDTLKLSRRYVRGLENYKLITLAEHYGMINEKAHRAENDAVICGDILFKLINIIEKNIEKQNEIIPLQEKEVFVCAVLQNILFANGFNTERLRFSKRGNGYVEVLWAYTVLKFKITSKQMYIIVEKKYATNKKCLIDDCSMSEGGDVYARLLFASPLELFDHADYFVDKFRSYCEIYRHFEESDWYRSRYKLTEHDVEEIVQRIKETHFDIHVEQRKEAITREMVKINPRHERVPVNEIMKKSKMGLDYYEEGEALRKSKEYARAIEYLDAARMLGFCYPELYESYAKLYGTLKDYDNLIAICDEAIDKCRDKSIKAQFITRRNRALKNLYDIQHKQKKIKPRIETTKETEKEEKGSSQKAGGGKNVIMMNDEGEIVNEYESIAAASRETGINTKSIREAAKGKQKHAGGYCWKYGE